MESNKFVKELLTGLMNVLQETKCGQEQKKTETQCGQENPTMETQC